MMNEPRIERANANCQAAAAYFRLPVRDGTDPGPPFGLKDGGERVPIIRHEDVRRMP
jgi:hypothetical protein